MVSFNDLLSIIEENSFWKKSDENEMYWTYTDEPQNPGDIQLLNFVDRLVVFNPNIWNYLKARRREVSLATPFVYYGYEIMSSPSLSEEEINNAKITIYKHLKKMATPSFKIPPRALKFKSFNKAEYNNMINTAVDGFFNKNLIKVKDFDVIVIPGSESAHVNDIAAALQSKFKQVRNIDVPIINLEKFQTTSKDISTMLGINNEQDSRLIDYIYNLMFESLPIKPETKDMQKIKTGIKDGILKFFSMKYKKKKTSHVSVTRDLIFPATLGNLFGHDKGNYKRFNLAIVKQYGASQKDLDIIDAKQVRFGNFINKEIGIFKDSFAKENLPQYSSILFVDDNINTGKGAVKHLRPFIQRYPTYSWSYFFLIVDSKFIHSKNTVSSYQMMQSDYLNRKEFTDDLNKLRELQDEYDNLANQLSDLELHNNDKELLKQDRDRISKLKSNLKTRKKIITKLNKHFGEGSIEGLEQKLYTNINDFDAYMKELETILKDPDNPLVKRVNKYLKSKSSYDPLNPQRRRR